jgi:hypothetical protein
MMTAAVALPLWLLWGIAIIVVVLPLVLMAAFHRANLADSRGRRLSGRWHT